MHPQLPLQGSTAHSKLHESPTRRKNMFKIFQGVGCMIMALVLGSDYPCLVVGKSLALLACCRFLPVCCRASLWVSAAGRAGVLLEIARHAAPQACSFTRRQSLYFFQEKPSPLVESFAPCPYLTSALKQVRTGAARKKTTLQCPSRSKKKTRRSLAACC